MPPSDSLSQNEFRFPRNMKPEGLNNVYRFGRHIIHLLQPYVINIQDVEPDGNCGFRSIAVGLGFDENHWAFIRQQLLQELDFNADCTDMCLTPTTQDLMTLPRHNAVSVVHLGIHFINVTLQGYYPMPTVNPIWKRYRNDAASDWEFVYHDRLQEYQRFIDENNLSCSTNEEGDLWPGMARRAVLDRRPGFGLWLQFEPESAAATRCRRILWMNVATPRCIDWGILADAREAARARAILGEDTPWTRLLEIAELPTHRLITVEFLSTFQYRAHQAAVREQDDEELPPDIEFSLCGQHFEMSIEQFAVHLGIYYEPETVRDDFIQGPHRSSSYRSSSSSLRTMVRCWNPSRFGRSQFNHRREESSPQHPPHVYRAVRLTEPLEALLHQIAVRCDEMAQAAWKARVERRLDRYEDLVQWTVASEHARRDESQLPPFPKPRVYLDDGSSVGPSGGS
ncbi:hypothetical protein E3N88_05466 [Mikania micrantha]|uniref:OTU domain-containing protein n=1 Tax=Mikania micrantha TaxID=192012 RepID=A0A5N6PN69_9ASTR|nr:hypothetical protein E3N88_05466 [Mikania micrantha]